jgi:ankyrin repeat protein
MPTDSLPPLHEAVLARQPEIVRQLISEGADPHEGIYPFRDFTSALQVAKERGFSEIVAVIESTDRPEDKTGDKTAAEAPASSTTLWECAGTGDYELAKKLLDNGADPNEAVFASGSPMLRAFSQSDEKMIALLLEYGGKPEATLAGLFRLTDLARQMLAGTAAYRLDGVGGESLPEQLLWGAACGGDPEILDVVDWPRDDPRWFQILEQPLRVWSYGKVSASWDRSTYPVCFGLLLKRSDPNTFGRFGVTILHSVAGSRRHVTAEENVRFATLLLEAGSRLDARDRLFDRTPSGWAELRNRRELVELYQNHVSYPPSDSA